MSSGGGNIICNKNGNAWCDTDFAIVQKSDICKSGIRGETYGAARCKSIIATQSGVGNSATNTLSGIIRGYQ